MKKHLQLLAGAAVGAVLLTSCPSPDGWWSGSDPAPVEQAQDQDTSSADADPEAATDDPKWSGARPSAARLRRSAGPKGSAGTFEQDPMVPPGGDSGDAPGQFERPAPGGSASPGRRGPRSADRRAAGESAPAAG